MRYNADRPACGEAPIPYKPMSLERRHLLFGFVTVALIAGACKADERRSDAADREAAVLALVAALDHTMLLSDRQREELRVLFSEHERGLWRTPRTWHALMNPRRSPWQSAMIRASFAVLEWPDSELASILRPPQLAVCRELRTFALILVHRDSTEPRPHELLFELSLGDVAAICELSDEQRAGLQFIGKSDLNRSALLASRTVRYGRGDENDPAEPAMPGPSLAAGTLPGDLPRYRKALEQWLTTEQRQKLETAHQRRREFERQAELAAIARIVCRDAALNEEQSGRLSGWLDDRMCETSHGDAAVCVRSELLVALSRLSPDEVAAVVGAEASAIASVWKQLRTELRRNGLAETIPTTR